MKCRLCDAQLDRIVIDLRASPLSNSYLRAEDLDRMEPNYPLRVRLCDSCRLLQLPELHRAEGIFGDDYQYFSSYSDSWVKHAADYVSAMCARFGYGGRSKIIEVASNDGYLLQHFVARGVPVLGIEPAANVAEVARQKGIPTTVRFFGKQLAEELAREGGRADLIAGNNVFAHVPDLRDFVEGLRIALAPGGTITLEFPHLVRLVDENQFDTIYHEHFSYFTFTTASRALENAGLRVFDVEELTTHGGSLRVFARHGDEGHRAVSPRVAALLQRERDRGFDGPDAYAGMQARADRVKRDLLRFLIESKQAGRRVVGYGAPAKGNTLLNFCGVGTDLLEFTVDRSPHKQGRFLPGSRIPIEAPSRIVDTKPDYVLLLPWNLRDEITEQMSIVRSWGGRFVVPIPSLEVLS
jgi:SAM-dependent methyltransferase